MTLHEQSTEDLRRMLADGSLGPKKAAVAEATLRRRQSDRIRNWFQRHPWLAGVASVIGLAGMLLGLRTRSNKGGNDG